MTYGRDQFTNEISGTGVKMGFPNFPYLYLVWNNAIFMDTPSKDYWQIVHG